MNLNQLRVFYYAAREGSQSLAAQKLYISQPAVNKALNRLQEEQSVQLFTRDGNRLYVTDAGSKLYEIAEELFELESKCDNLLENLRNEDDSHLRIDASLSFGDYYIPELISHYKKHNPEVHVSVSVHPTQDIVSKSLKMKNDIAFYSFKVEDPSLHLEPIVSEELVIICHPDHRFSKLKYILPEDLNGEVLISHEQGSIQREIMDKMIRLNNLDIERMGVEYTSNEAIKRAVLQGNGIALISERAVQDAVKAKDLYAVQMGRRPLKRQLYMGWHRDRVMTDKLDKLIELCHDLFRV